MGPRPRGRGILIAAIFRAGRRMASMGPRPRGRGIWRWRWCCCTGWWSFNGAATARSRNCGYKARVASTRVASTLNGFNGAATARSRNCGLAERGGAHTESFNGAATARSRNYDFRCDEDHHGRIASMGPRPRGRGIDRQRETGGHRDGWLQWGRDRAVAELALPLSYSVFKDLHMPSRAAPRARRVSPSSLVPRRRKLLKPIPLIPRERSPRFLRRPAARIRHRVIKTG